ncbi:unnamed protein product [Phyllotreta striolata]|uniref:Nicotinamide-nucleotide adenylyltransferase n=1 Tax=Phyllotreta striolata TaxID=444603 RepID=A0A9N9TDF4_PHYSR|nr:unnamed protein product [Phyllotreta striolata]
MSPQYPTRVVLLACGSYNPVTNMHLRMFEIAKDYLHNIGNCVVIGGVISPVHDAYGKKDLVSSTHRLEMLRSALQNHEWIRLSDWECRQENWSLTKQVIRYHQNHLNAAINRNSENDQLDINENELKWIPENVKLDNRPIKVKLLCGADLLESFGTPGLWADEDLEEIVGQQGLIVITRMNTNPSEFIYNSDLLSKYMANITLVTEWITNEISSTKIRRALRRNESVRYLVPDRVLEYIYRNNLYGSQRTSKYLQLPFREAFPTPSPDAGVATPSVLVNCLNACNNNNNNNNVLHKRATLSIDTVDGFTGPGHAVKITGETVKITGDGAKEVSRGGAPTEEEVEGGSRGRENLVKFIFTKHGIQVISDVETIV